MKAALVNLYYRYSSLNKDGFYRIPHLPLSIAKLNAFLREKGIKPAIIDFNAMPYNGKNKSENFDKFFYHSKRIVDYFFGSADLEINNFYEKLVADNKLAKFDVVGFSISSSSQILPALLLANKIKKRNRDCRVVFGGAFNVSSASLPYLNDVDFIIRKEGEMAFYLLIRKSAGYDVNFSDIPGLVYKKGKKYLKNENIVLDINKLPAPSFEGFDLDAYRFDPKTYLNNRLNYLLSLSFPLNYEERGKILVLPYDFIKGCPYFCFFCANNERKIQIKSPELTVSQIDEMKKKYKTRHFNFLNHTFNISANLVDSFYDAVRSNGMDITWNDCARPNSMILTSSRLENMRKIGCNGLAFGVESGNQEMLATINRNYSVAGAQKVIRNSKKLGMWVSANFIVGYPYETDAQFKDTLSFISGNFKYIDSFAVSKFRLHKESYIGKNTEKFNIKVTDNFVPEQIIEETHNALNFCETNGLSAVQKSQQQNERLDSATKLITDLYKKQKDLNTL